MSVITASRLFRFVLISLCSLWMLQLLNYQCVAGQVVSSDPNVNDEDTDGNTNDGTDLSDPSDLGNGLDDGTTGDDIGPDPGPDPDDATSMGGADQDGTGIEGNTTMPLTTSTGPMPISTQITEESMKPFSFVSWQLSILEDNKRRMNAFDRGFQDSLYTLKKKADLALKSNQTYTVTSKQNLAPSMNKHDYLSLARYYWPNNSTANGLPYIRRDGYSNPEINTAPDYKLFRTLTNDIQYLSLASFFFDNFTYAEKAIDRIKVWFIDEATRMNPQLQYASYIRGFDDGRRTGIIDFSVVANFLDAIPILQKAPSWSPSYAAALRDWFNQYLQWLKDSDHGLEEKAAKNNHGTYYDCQYIAICIFLNRTEEAIAVAKNATIARISQQIQVNGSQPHEEARAASWYYSIYNLNGLLNLGKLSSQVGVDLFGYTSSDGRGIHQAIEYLIPFSKNYSTWPYPSVDGYNATIHFSEALQNAYVAYKNPQYLSLSRELLGKFHVTHNITRLLQPFEMFAQVEASSKTNTVQLNSPATIICAFSLIYLFSINSMPI